MALLTALTSRFVVDSNNYSPRYFQASAAMKTGELVEYVSANTVAVCTTDDHAIGVVGCDSDHDLSTDYAAGERVPIWMLGCGATVYVLCYDADQKTIEEGLFCCSSDATAGAGSLQDAYTDTVDRTDSLWWTIGRFAESGTLLATTVTYIKVKLSI